MRAIIALASLLTVLPAHAADKALGVAMALAAHGQCSAVPLDMDALARLIAAEERNTPGFEERVEGGLLEGAILKVRSMTASERDAHCAAMAKVIRDAGLGG